MAMAREMLREDVPEGALVEMLQCYTRQLNTTIDRYSYVYGRFLGGVGVSFVTLSGAVILIALEKTGRLPENLEILSAATSMFSFIVLCWAFLSTRSSIRNLERQLHGEIYVSRRIAARLSEGIEHGRGKRPLQFRLEMILFEAERTIIRAESSRGNAVDQSEITTKYYADAEK